MWLQGGSVLHGHEAHRLYLFRTLTHFPCSLAVKAYIAANLYVRAAGLGSMGLMATECHLSRMLFNHSCSLAVIHHDALIHM